MPQKSVQPRVGGITDITDMAKSLNILKSHGINVDMSQFQTAVDTIVKGAKDPNQTFMAPAPKAPAPKTVVAKTVEPSDDTDETIDAYDYASDPKIKVYKDKETGRMMIAVVQELGPKVVSKSHKSYVYKVQRLPQVELADGSRLTINPLVAYNTIPKKLRT